MRKVLVLLLLFCCTLMSAQQTFLHADTLDAKDLLGKADDAYLLDVIGQQAKEKAAHDSLLHIFRLEYDLTTIVPAHLGYADSLRIADIVRQQYGTTVLCVPQLYQPAPLPSFCELDYSAGYRPAHAEDSVLTPFKSIPPFRQRQAVRSYLTAHAAGLYTGVANPEMIASGRVELAEQKSEYELEIPTRSLVKDAEADRQEQLNRIKNKLNPWYKELTTMLQFTQNYVSPNWYEGGTSNLSMYATIKGQIKYNDKKRITWENYLEWNEGFSTTHGDSIHKINTSEDLFRLYSKLGIKIVPKLYGSFSAEYRSQVLPTFNTNSNMRKTTFMTPVRFNLALGVDYKPISNVSIVVSPAAFKLVYANDTVRTKYTDFGIAAGEKKLAEFGSSVRVEGTWKPLREIALEGKFYAYTNYKMVELDMEINCDFIINRYLSARVKLHPRYDSSRIMDGQTRAHVQFKELISIGFAHKFY